MNEQYKMFMNSNKTLDFHLDLEVRNLIVLDDGSTALIESNDDKDPRIIYKTKYLGELYKIIQKQSTRWNFLERPFKIIPYKWQLSSWFLEILVKLRNSLRKKAFYYRHDEILYSNKNIDEHYDNCLEEILKNNKDMNCCNISLKPELEMFLFLELMIDTISKKI